MINMYGKFFFVFLSIFLIIGSTQIAFAGGSGSEESDVLFINQNYYKIKLETNPSILKGDESQITFDINMINDDTGKIISGVDYKIEIFDGQKNLLVDFYAYSPNEKLETIIIPSQNLNFIGETTENGSLLASNLSPLTIEAPLFLGGGLVDVNITVLSIDSEPVLGTDTTFHILFTVGEFIPFSTQIDNITHDLMFATYFDKIEEFHYDSKNKKLSVQMSFNWDKDFIESIPFVHAEYYIPKSVDIFENYEINLTINDISYFGTIDRSGDKEIVVHFLLSSKKLLKLYDEINSDQNDKIIFGIESGKKRDVQKKDASLEGGDKVIILSTEEDWKFHLSLTPEGKINPNNEISLHIEFHDPITNTLISQIEYDINVFLNGKNVESLKGLETPDGRDSIRITLDDVGSVIVRISNVNNFDTSGEFLFNVYEPKDNLTGDYVVNISTSSSLPECKNDNSCYVPSSLNIQTNQIVLWKNMDNVAHTVTLGTSDVGVLPIFDSKIIEGGEKFSFKFENQGIFDYFCTLHPWMTGTISVGEFKSVVPVWIKNNAKWWSDNQISDEDFASGLEFLIKEDTLKIPLTTQGSSSTSNEIPDWIRNNAGWWADGSIDDETFVQGLEFLIKQGILQI